jgi:hypothetical protein
MKLSELNIYDFGHEIQLAGAIYMGKGQVLLALFPDEERYPIDNFSDDRGGGNILELSNTDWEILLRQTDLADTPAPGPAKAILRKSQRQIDSSITWAVFRRDRYRCRYCGADDRPLTVDHIDLWENGGITTEENLVAACRQCNKLRGRTPYDEWLESADYRRVSGRNRDEGALAANRGLVSRLIELKKKRMPVQKVRSR